MGFEPTDRCYTVSRFQGECNRPLYHPSILGCPTCLDERTFYCPAGARTQIFPFVTRAGLEPASLDSESRCPAIRRSGNLVASEELESPTLSLGRSSSIQLSYEAILRFHSDSNRDTRLRRPRSYPLNDGTLSRKNSESNRMRLLARAAFQADPIAVRDVLPIWVTSRNRTGLLEFHRLPCEGRSQPLHHSHHVHSMSKISGSQVSRTPCDCSHAPFSRRAPSPSGLSFQDVKNASYKNQPARMFEDPSRLGG